MQKNGFFITEKFSYGLSMLTGPETKELFSMAGLMSAKEFFKWSNDDAIDTLFGR